MKRFVCLWGLLICLVGCSRGGGLLGCKYDYRGWIDTSIPEFGTIQVPVDWKSEEVDGFLYFYIDTDEGKHYVLYQYYFSCPKEADNPYSRDVTFNPCFDNILAKVNMGGDLSSNQAQGDRYVYVYPDGSTVPGYMIEFNGFDYEKAAFIAFKEDVTDDEVDMIVESYISFKALQD